MDGYERRRGEFLTSTPGSYGHMIKSLADGLALASGQGWISATEAKREFRRHILSIQANKAIEDKVKELEEQLAEARAELDGEGG